MSAIKDDEMNRTKIASAITWLTTLALLVSICASMTFTGHASAQSPKDEVSAIYPVLSMYAVDLTALAFGSRVEATPQQDAIARQVIASLLVNSQTPVLVGESGLDRETIARSVAAKIAFNNVPELRGKRVFRLSLDALANGARSTTEFTARVKSGFREAANADGRVILFIDQLQEYAGVRATLAVSASLKQTLETSHVRVIGGATAAAFSQYVLADEGLAKLFESVPLDRSGDIASSAKVGADKRRSPVNEEFEGEKISSDMRDLMRSAGANGRVSAILQVDDVNAPAINALLKQR